LQPPAIFFFSTDVIMRNLLILVLTAILTIACSCSLSVPDNFVFVKGGTYKNRTIANFYISKFEVTQKEWMTVMGSNPSTFKGANLPVETVSWYDCIDYCNKRSIQEGLLPYYIIDRNKKDANNTNELDDLKWTVTINKKANGYRLPTEAEWEYAASGGALSQHYAYSGSNDLDEIAWYWKNSGDKYLTGNWSWAVLEQNHNKTKPVAARKPNELGLYDMSGNVREWCWDWQAGNAAYDAQGRIWKGGGWMGADFCCAPTFGAAYEANGKGTDQGLRVCRGVR
jgi:formylglycine-generating enzyme